MSFKVTDLVWSKQLPPFEKYVLLRVADRVDHDGKNFFSSKKTIMKETGLSRSTVFKVFKSLVKQRLLIEAGQRDCNGGHTVVYDVNLNVLQALPGGNGRSDDGPPEELPSSARETAASVPDAPKQPFEPSMNKEAAGTRELRDYFVEKKATGAERIPDDLVRRIVEALGYDLEGRVPKYWLAPDATLFVQSWLKLDLSEDEIIEIAVHNMKAYNEPARGPKRLDKLMTDFAAEKIRSEEAAFRPAAIPTTTERITFDRTQFDENGELYA
ncbi:helix-turn-helix domain-containing protein [Salipiger bermudensis]|uniref:helix-turn-helix domain-containing protein n=1 Tax=Salipiger bermudensis TaxID=344736 RepID=UPI00300AE6A0